MITRISRVCVLLVMAQTCCAQGQWNHIGDMPEIRYAHTVNELNGKIYVVGGMNTETSVYPRTILVYDTSSGTWTQIPLCNNTIRAAHSSCVVGGRLYVMGGNDSSRTVSTMDMFDPASSQWVSQNSMSTDRGLAACVSIADKIFVIGGMRFQGINYDFNGLRTVEVYDTNSGTWTHLADMPTGRWGHSAAAVNGMIYVFGGASALGGWNVYSSEVYNPQTNTWTAISNMPTARYCLTACSLEGSIYTIGGWKHSSDGPVYDNVEVYNPDKDMWFTETPMPVARAVVASTVVDGKIYVYGGARTTHPNIGTSGIYEFERAAGLAYPYDARLSRHGRDTVGITTRVENPLAHTLSVVGILTSGSGSLIDTLLLKDDGVHGDSSSADGLWGYLYVPEKDDTITVTIRADDRTDGTSRTLHDAVTMLFTRGAMISIDTRAVDLGAISLATSHLDTGFIVRNTGYSADSVRVSLDPVNVVPDTAVSAFPTLFALAPGDSRSVTFRIRPGPLPPCIIMPRLLWSPYLLLVTRGSRRTTNSRWWSPQSPTSPGFRQLLCLDKTTPTLSTLPRRSDTGCPTIQMSG